MKYKVLLAFFILSLVVRVAGAVDRERQATPFPMIRVTYHLQTWLDQVEKIGKLRVGGVTIHATPLVFAFYQTRGFRPAWSNDQGPVYQEIDKLISQLQSAPNDGLEPEDYHLKKIENILRKARTPKGIQSMRPIKLAALDLLLTDAFFLYASHVANGRVDPREVDEQLPVAVRDFNLRGMLEEVLVTGKMRECFDRLAPVQPEYLQLRLVLEHYRKIASALDAVSVEPLPVLRRGDRDPARIPALRIKLNLFGDLAEAVAVDDTLLDRDVEAALSRFQKRHGLEPDGVWNEETAKRFNQPAAVAIRRLEVNLERLRWHPMNWEEEYIRVNIPDFSLSVMRGNKEQLAMRVVAGQTYSKTPLFSDQLRFIVINPYWEIPANIILRDKLYAIRHEPDYFEKRNIKVVQGWGKDAREINPKSVDWMKVRIKDFFETYRLQQASGPGNPLGRIKFMFPNEYNVYLHDTPQKELFNQAVRSFSSGCIRLEKPYELAAYCLRKDPFWNKARLKSALDGALEQKIKLTNPIPIHILYWTAWVDQDGWVHFLEDVYGRDETIMNAFEKVYFPDYSQPGESGTQP